MRMCFVQQILCILSVMLTGLMSYAQPTQGLVAYYSFDGCDAFDDSGNGADGVLSGSPGCACGVSGNSLALDGVDDNVSFLGNFDLLLASDFTFSFYILPENTTGIIDLISKREDCSVSKSLTIRYESGSRTMRAELAESINFRSESKAVLEDNVCWHHITWVRNGTTLLLYVNGILVNTVNTPGPLDATNDGVLSIANSPCLANGEQRLRGRIDEFRLYNRALTSAEVEDLYTPVDDIATQDVFLFSGESAQISVPNSCADTYAWTPVNGVTTPVIAEPTITPAQTTTYTLTMMYPACTATDTVRIIVLDSTQVDCDDVFVPNAFTPNDDGLNDAFGISNRFFLGEFVGLEIYDRWGTQLFHGTVPEDKWNGTYQGEDSVPDMYIYKLYYRCNGQDKVIAGSVALIK